MCAARVGSVTLFGDKHRGPCAAGVLRPGFLPMEGRARQPAGKAPTAPRISAQGPRLSLRRRAGGDAAQILPRGLHLQSWVRGPRSQSIAGKQMKNNRKE